MAEVEQSSSATMIGRIVVEQGLASNEEVERCVARWQSNADSDSGGESFAGVLVTEGVITEAQMRRVLTQVQQQRSQQQVPGYKILKKLGEGAMGRVYKARQISLDRMVAIKVLPRRFSTDQNFVERFYAEGRAAAKLNHPNIVGAYDVGQAGDYHYFVMEYVEGHTVWDVLERDGRYAESDALAIIIQMAEALGHAAERGFIHRDVKPKNIMITAQGLAKLADMGLARQMSDVEAAEAEAGKAFGTPYYISPEQIRGEIDIDARADIYGLGATLYHMLTGKVPFEAATPSQVMHKHLKAELVPPDHVNESLSAGISEIVEVMMAKSRDRRYPAWPDVLEDLRAVEAGQPPMQARKKFDVSSLADLEASGGPATQSNAALSPDTASTRPDAPLLEHPLFWLLIGSAVLNVLLLVLWLMK